MKHRLLLLLLIPVLLLTACAFPESKNTSLTHEEIIASENTAEFHFIDVGQGDCILVQNKDVKILIDAGTTQSGAQICAYLENLGIDYLDCFIGTHPHEDHLGGAAAVLSEIQVEKVYLNGETSNSYFFERLVDTLIDKNITPTIPEFHSPYEFGKFKVEFISPTTDFENTNNNSLVTIISYGDVRLLLTGDIERPVEAELIYNEDTTLEADILKVGHHGSRNGTSNEFLKAVNPSVAVIQCGKDNSYGHPHKEALTRLENADIEILRTDENGSVILRTDGNDIFNASGEKIQEQESQIEIKYIGNKKSRVYHSEACPNLPKEQNQILFSSREDAENSQYTPCGNCMQ